MLRSVVRLHVAPLTDPTLPTNRFLQRLSPRLWLSSAPIASLRHMAKKKGRKRKILGIAALGALAAWIVGKRKSSSAPEGVWKDEATEPQES